MGATPADIAKYTQPGVDIVEQDETLRDAHPDAQDLSEDVLELPFETVAAGETIMAERFDLLSTIAPFHAGIEVDELLDIGGAIPLTPVVPSFTIRFHDDTEVVARLRAFVYDTQTERFSIEVIE